MKVLVTIVDGMRPDALKNVENYEALIGKLEDEIDYLQTKISTENQDITVTKNGYFSKMTDKMFKVGIIGAGWIAEKMAAALASLEDYCVYAIASRSIEKAQAFAERWNVAEAYGSYEEMVADEQVDLVYIATPHSHHFPHAMFWLRRHLQLIQLRHRSLSKQHIAKDCSSQRPSGPDTCRFPTK